MTTNPDSELAYILIIGTVGTLLITISLILFVISYQKRNLANKLKLQKLETQHQLELTDASFKGQEKERERISQDLHDDIGSLLSATKLQVNLLKMKVKDSPELTRLVDESLGTISSTIGEVRSISRNLAPYLLNSLGFSKAVDYLVQRVVSSPEFEVCFQENGQPVPLDDKKQINLYRSVQELINNAVKHSKASRLDISLKWHDCRLEIIIRDNGTGFNPDAIMQSNNHGLGLLNIKSRLGIAGAELKIESSDEGTTATIKTMLK